VLVILGCYRDLAAVAVGVVEEQKVRGVDDRQEVLRLVVLLG